MLGGSAPLTAVVAFRMRAGGRRGERMAIDSLVPTSGGFGFGSRTFVFCKIGSDGCGGI